MRKLYYQVSEEIEKDVFMHVNCMNGVIVLLDKYAHTLYENLSDKPFTSSDLDNKIMQSLIHNQFIVEDDYNEKEIVQYRRMKEINDTSMYHLIINPTLDCNLSCWYCYEHKYKGSKIAEPIVEGIKKHINWKLENEPFSTLKLSFFGGEPFYNYPPIESLIDYVRKVCTENGKNLYLDFTTNGTLLTKSIVSFLSNYSCQFEITIDGNRQQHNKIKHTRDCSIDTYSLTFKNVLMIQSMVPDSLIFLRINFDGATLKNFDDIYEDIMRMDKRRTIVILKRIWQVDDKDVSNEEVVIVARKLQTVGFRVDYYTQGKLCFAERMNEAVINYDGKVFKCTTISDFNSEYSYGNLDLESGQIVWNVPKLAKDYNTFSPRRCLSCRMYPMCYGPCPNRINAGNATCYIDSLNMSRKEYFHYILSEYMLTNNL